MHCDIQSQPIRSRPGIKNILVHTPANRWQVRYRSPRAPSTQEIDKVPFTVRQTIREYKVDRDRLDSTFRGRVRGHFITASSQEAPGYYGDHDWA